VRQVERHRVPDPTASENRHKPCHELSPGILRRSAYASARTRRPPRRAVNRVPGRLRDSEIQALAAESSFALCDDLGAKHPELLNCDTSGGPEA